MWTIVLLIFLSLLIGIGVWFIFLWSVKSGQYDDPEGPKYRMLEEDDAGTTRGCDKKHSEEKKR